MRELAGAEKKEKRQADIRNERDGQHPRDGGGGIAPLSHRVAGQYIDEKPKRDNKAMDGKPISELQTGEIHRAMVVIAAHF
jgi:hypothetical protein